MSEYIILRNITAKPVAGRLGPKHFTVDPFEVINCESEDEAMAIIEAFPGFFERMQPEFIGEGVEPELPQTMWLANMTGNPDAPKEVQGGTFNNPMTGRTEPKMVVNYFSSPRPYLFYYRPPEKKVSYSHSVAGGTTMIVSEGKQCLRVNPWQRIEVPKYLGQQLLERISRGDTSKSGWVIASRPPSKFEPDASWSLDDIRTWLLLVDPQGITPEILGPPTSLLNGLAVKELKRKHLNRVFLRAANPKFKLPNHADFKEFKGSDEVQNLLYVSERFGASEQLDGPVAMPPPKRKGGRPRKNQVQEV
jgi:hypothetical protein